MLEPTKELFEPTRLLVKCQFQKEKNLSLLDIRLQDKFIGYIESHATWTQW